MHNLDNKGWLGKNMRPKHSKSPEYIGVINIGGRKIRLAGWVRDGKNGKYIALRISDDDNNTRAVTSGGNRGVDDDDDIPF